MPRIYVLSGPDLGTTHDFEDTVVLGRALEVELPVRGKSISRRHAQLALEGGRWVLSDLGSSNGTWLGAKRLKCDEWLEDGDEFKLGEIELRFRLDVPPDEKPAPERPAASSDVRSAATESRAAPVALPEEPEPSPPPSPPVPELEGDWSDGPVEPSLPLRAAPRPKPSTAAVSPTAGRARAFEARRAQALGATRVSAPTASNQRVLQYSRVTQREGVFGADLDQQPGFLRWGLYLLVAGFFAALLYGSFELTTRVREARGGDVPVEDGG